MSKIMCMLKSVLRIRDNFLLRYVYIIFQKYKVIKKSQNSRNQGLMDPDGPKAY
jgi:hypothetical protein